MEHSKQYFLDLHVIRVIEININKNLLKFILTVNG